MTRITVGTWDQGLASGVLHDAGHALGLVEGQQVEIEVRGDDIIIRRLDAKPKLSAAVVARARAAADEIIADSRGRSLAGLSIKELIDEGRP